MEEKVVFRNSKRDKIVGILSTPTKDKTKGIIILVHGFSSNKKTANFILLKQMLDTHNIHSLGIDIYGHGESEGKFENVTITEAVDDVLQGIEFVKQRGYVKIGLVGSSFGGLTSILVAAKSEDLSLLVLKSPVSNFPDLYMWKKTPVEEWKRKGYRDYFSGRMGKLKLNYSFYEDALINNGYEAAAKITVPTFIVHGDQDEDVTVEQSIKLSKLIPDCTLKIVQGADHRYTQSHHRDQMLKAISEFIFNHT